MWYVTALTSLALLLSGCGKTLQVDGFEKQVNAFTAASVQAGHPLTIDNLVIQEDNLGGNTFGECVTKPLHPPTILVNRVFWEARSVTDRLREIVLFHELGHCILGRQHNSELRADGAPSSIMDPNPVDEQKYEALRSYYVQELFAENARAELNSTDGQL